MRYMFSPGAREAADSKQFPQAVPKEILIHIQTCAPIAAALPGHPAGSSGRGGRWIQAMRA
jgi:hypothetical protein